MWSPGRINGTSGSRGGAEWADLWPLGDDVAPTSPEDDCFLSFSGLRHARVFQLKDEDDAMGGMASRERLTREGVLISDRSLWFFREKSEIRATPPRFALTLFPSTRYEWPSASGIWQADSRGADDRLWLALMENSNR